jgi:elongation factor G
MRLQGKLLSQVWVSFLDILVDRMRREFKVEVNQGEPQVEYKEAFLLGFIEKTYKKQSGGRGKFGDIVFKLEPADEVEVKFLLVYNLLML